MLASGEQIETGEFKRQKDHFTAWVAADGSTEYPAEAGRYHLYVSLACPWAHRTVIVRKLKCLEEVVGMTVVDPIRDDEGWAFRDGEGYSEDPVNGFRFLSEAYRATAPDYLARFTVPVLWDVQQARIVSNDDDHIMRMLNSEFDAFTDSDLDLYPQALRSEIDNVNDLVFPNVNDGVYRAGFATTQPAYERAVTRLFATLDELDDRLSPPGVIWSAIRSRKPTGACSRPWCASTPCILSISSATCGGSATIPICGVTCGTSTSSRASPRP